MSQAPPTDVTRSQPDSELSLGRELQRAREVRGISREDVAAETRISLRHLAALEEDRLADLPGKLYARNFVRAYARVLGADETELLDFHDYQWEVLERADEAREPAAAWALRRHLPLLGLGAAVLLMAVVLAWSLSRVRGEGAAEADGRAPVSQVPAAGSEAVASDRARRSPEEPRPAAAAAAPEEEAGARTDDAAGAKAEDAAAVPEGPTPVAAGAGAAAAAAAEPEPEPAGARPASDEGVEGVAEAPVAEPSAREQPAEPEPAVASEAPSEGGAQAPRIELVFEEASWIEVWREGESDPTLGLKSRGERLRYELDRPLRIHLGNAGGVRLLVNGLPARPLGSSGESYTLRIDDRNWRTFLE